MRPYLTIIKDSFHEATSSRVLWVLLILITLVLASLAPMGYRQQLTTGLGDREVFDRYALALRIAVAGADEKPSPGRRIWNLLDEPVQQDLTELPRLQEEAADGNLKSAFQRDHTLGELVRRLDEMLRRRDFYDKASWEGVPLRAEARELLDQGLEELSTREVGRLNRLLVEAAYGDLIRVSPPRETVFTYLGRDTWSPLPLGEKEFRASIKHSLAWQMKWFFGTAVVLVAVLVTAPMIPQTLEPGSLNLLLSKPITRPLLFLAKYAGGCAFILINVTYLMVGLWLILGLRLGIWEQSLLLYIPVYMLIFAIYYSVSALAGAVWRSTVVAIVITVVFWLVCFGAWAAKSSVETLVIDPARLVKLVPAGDALLGVNEAGLVVQWDKSQRGWHWVFRSGQDAKNPFGLSWLQAGPIYDAKGDQLVAVASSPEGTGAELALGKRAHRWQRTAGAPVPPGTVELVTEPDGSVIAVSILGIFRFGPDLENRGPGATEPEDKASRQADPPFQWAGPEKPLRLGRPLAVAANRDDGALAVYSQGTLTLLAVNTEGMYEQKRAKELVQDARQSAALGFGGSTLLLARSDGTIMDVDAATLKVRRRWKPAGPSEPRSVAAASGGRRFAIVFRNRELWLYDAQEKKMTRPRVTGQGDISAAAFLGKRRLLVADRAMRVCEYRLDPLQLDQRRAPKMNLLEKSYRYVIVPFYTIFPKPGELDDVVKYFMTQKESKPTGQTADDLARARAKLNPWTPVWSGLVFMAVMLGLGCWSVQRQEF